jgi:UDP-perosamine 4-acetyltransferase
MKKKLSSIVIGTGGHARAVISLLKKSKNYIIEGLIDISPNFDISERILDCPVIGGQDFLETLSRQNSNNFFLAIGDNYIRRNIFHFLVKNDAKLPNLFDPYSFVDQSVEYGQGNIFFHNSYVGPSVKLGCNNIFNTGCVVEHNSSVLNHCHLAPNSVICGNSHIDDLCFLGANSTVINNIKICSEIKLGAGSTVTKSIKNKSSTYVGSPAREIERK